MEKKKNYNLGAIILTLFVLLTSIGYIDNIYNLHQLQKQVDNGPHYVCAEKEHSNIIELNESKYIVSDTYDYGMSFIVPKDGTYLCNDNIVVSRNPWEVTLHADERQNGLSYIATVINKSQTGICIVKWTTTNCVIA